SRRPRTGSAPASPAGPTRSAWRRARTKRARRAAPPPPASRPPRRTSGWGGGRPGSPRSRGCSARTRATARRRARTPPARRGQGRRRGASSWGDGEAGGGSETAPVPGRPVQAGGLSTGRAGERLPLRPAVHRARRVDPAADVVDGGDDEVVRVFEVAHEVLVDDGRDVLLRLPDVPPREQVVLQALQLDEPRARDVLDSDGAEVGEPGEGAERAELARLRLVDDDLAGGVAVGEAVDLLLPRLGWEAQRHAALGADDVAGHVLQREPGVAEGLLLERRDLLLGRRGVPVAAGLRARFFLPCLLHGRVGFGSAAGYGAGRGSVRRRGAPRRLFDEDPPSG